MSRDIVLVTIMLISYLDNSWVHRIMSVVECISKITGHPLQIYSPVRQDFLANFLDSFNTGCCMFEHLLIA